MSKEEFEKWAASVDLNPVPYSDTHRAAYSVWKARQPEIDALKEASRLSLNAMAKRAYELEAEVERLRQKMDAPSFFLLGLSGAPSVPTVLRQAALMHHQALDAEFKKGKS